MNREPVGRAGSAAAGVTAVTALIAVAVAFGVDITDEQRNAVIGVVVALGPVVAALWTWWAARKHTTPITDPRTATGERLVPLSDVRAVERARLVKDTASGDVQRLRETILASSPVEEHVKRAAIREHENGLHTGAPALAVCPICRYIDRERKDSQLDEQAETWTDPKDGGSVALEIAAAGLGAAVMGALLLGVLSLGYYAATTVLDRPQQTVQPGYDDCRAHPDRDVCFTVRVP